MLKPRSGAPWSESLSDLFELGQRRVVERPELCDRARVARLPQPGDGLANLPDRASFQVEPLRLNDRLIADVQGPQSGLLEQRASLRADPERGEPERALLGKPHRGRDQALDGLAGTDRIARDDQHTALDAVAEKGRSLWVEQVVLVLAQLEERERVVAVLAHQRRCGVAELGVGQVPSEQRGDGRADTRRPEARTSR